MKRIAATLLSTLALSGVLAVTGGASYAASTNPPHLPPDVVGAPSGLGSGGGYGWGCSPDDPTPPPQCPPA